MGVAMHWPFGIFVLPTGVEYCEPTSSSVYRYQRVPPVSVSTFGIRSKSTDANPAVCL